MNRRIFFIDQFSIIVEKVKERKIRRRKGKEAEAKDEAEAKAEESVGPPGKG